MTVLGRLPGGFLLVEEVVAGPASYSTAAPPTIVFNDLSQNVEQIISINGSDQRQITNAGLTGRTLTFRVRGDNNPIGVVGDVLDEVADAVNLSGNTYRAFAYGH